MCHRPSFIVLVALAAMLAPLSHTPSNLALVRVASALAMKEL